jgi:aspartate racemase
MVNDKFRVGILGGMGPEAGVLLQSLIIEATSAERDQDHLKVITYTNPHVPDRTESLTRDGGASYLKAVTDSVQFLDRTGVDIIAIACNTAHARYEEIQSRIKTPILHIVNLAKEEISSTEGRVGILATTGTVKSGLFESAENPEKTLIPEPRQQEEVMAVIHAIKAGKKDSAVVDRLDRVIESLHEAGCKRMVLGCTELSVIYDELCKRRGAIFIDPLRLAARKLVELAG